LSAFIYDLPLVALYSASERKAHLEDSLGFQSDDAVPQQLELDDLECKFACHVRGLLGSADPLVLKSSDETLPSFLSHVPKGRGFGDPINTAVIIPIHVASRSTTIGFLVVGM